MQMFLLIWVFSGRIFIGPDRRGYPGNFFFLFLEGIHLSASHGCICIDSDNIFPFYTQPHDSGGVLWFHVGRLCVHPSISHTSIRPSIFCFRMITNYDCQS